MLLWDKIMLPKGPIIGCVDDMLKNTARLVYSRHRFVNNSIINLVSVITAPLKMKLKLSLDMRLLRQINSLSFDFLSTELK